MHTKLIGFQKIEMKNAIALFGLVITMVRKASANCNSVPAGFTVQGTSNAKCAVSIKLFVYFRFFPVYPEK